MLPNRTNAIIEAVEPLSSARRRSTSASPNSTSARPTLGSRRRPLRATCPKATPVKRAARRRGRRGSSGAVGRSRRSSSSSARVVAASARSVRSENSSSVSRPRATCSRSSATARSRSASEARSSGEPTVQVSHPRCERTFYNFWMRAEYREEPCKVALNRVKGMAFNWSLNPYMGCVHRCTFCYVRAFELRADRPFDDRYGTSIRVKVNVADVLRRELARPSWRSEGVAVGAATDPYQPAEGRYRLTRACIEVFAAASNPFSLITRGPLIVRDLDVLQEAARRAHVSVNFSVPTLDERVWRTTEPGTAPPRQRLRALQKLVDGGIKAGVGVAPILPGLSDHPDQLAAVVRAAREAGATHLWANVL